MDLRRVDFLRLVVDLRCVDFLRDDLPRLLRPNLFKFQKEISF
jgi:hypothetical protein